LFASGIASQIGDNVTALVALLDRHVCFLMADLENQYLSARTPRACRRVAQVTWPLFFYGWVGFVPWSASLSNGVISTLSNPVMGRPQIFRLGVALLTSVSVPRPNLPALIRFLSLSPIKLCLAIIAANGSIKLADAVILGRHIDIARTLFLPIRPALRGPLASTNKGFFYIPLSSASSWAVMPCYAPLMALLAILLSPIFGPFIASAVEYDLKFLVVAILAVIVSGRLIKLKSMSMDVGAVVVAPRRLTSFTVPGLSWRNCRLRFTVCNAGVGGEGERFNYKGCRRIEQRMCLLN
jgi:hypothetical protein